jgi:glycosyltransferase involved in cell wall biosynthesis
VIYSLGSGGAERVTATLSTEWARRGWDVTIVTISASEDVYPIAPSIRRRTLDLAGDSSGALAAIRQNVARIRALRRVILEERPDAVLGMMSTTAVLTILATRGLRVRVIVSERIHPPAMPLGREWELARRLVYPWADRVVALTDESRRWIESRAKGASVEVIPNAVVLPLPDSAPRVPPSSVLAPQARVLLAVGRLDHQKGFDVLIEAFARVASRFPEWHVVIAGDGPDRSPLHALVRSAGLVGRVHLVGRAGNMGDWYRRADLFVLSSRFEGFPNTLVEAMAHGCPVVSFDCDTGPRDIVRPGVDGWLVTPVSDSEALAATLQAVMDDDGARASAAARASEVCQRYSLERIADQWEAVLYGRSDSDGRRNSSGSPEQRSTASSLRSAQFDSSER